MNTRTNEKWLHPEAMQCMVDGQLSREQLADLIAACEQHPELWKCCAVAFLEEQAFRLELTQLAANWPATIADEMDQPSACWQPDDLLCGASPALLRSSPSLESSAGSSRGEPAEPRGLAGASWLNHLAFAATILLAFSLGWQTSRRFGSNHQLRPAPAAGQSTGQTSIAASTATPRTQTLPPSPGAHGTGPNASVQLAGAPSNASDSAEAALVSTLSSEAVAADAIEQALLRPEQFVPLDRRIPEPLAELEQRGLVHIESTEGFVPVRLRDGNTAVVPVQQIDLRPVRNAY